MTKRKRYLLCGHGESLPMAEDGATSLSSVLEDLAVEVCAEAVSARRRQRGAFRFRVGVVLRRGRAH